MSLSSHEPKLSTSRRPKLSTSRSYIGFFSPSFALSRRSIRTTHVTGWGHGMSLRWATSTTSGTIMSHISAEHNTTCSRSYLASLTLWSRRSTGGVTSTVRRLTGTQYLRSSRSSSSLMAALTMGFDPTSWRQCTANAWNNRFVFLHYLQHPSQTSHT